MVAYETVQMLRGVCAVHKCGSCCHGSAPAPQTWYWVEWDFCGGALQYVRRIISGLTPSPWYESRMHLGLVYAEYTL